MCLFQVPLNHATVAPLLLPDYTTRMGISAAMWLSPSLSHPTCYLQDRDEISDDVIFAKSRNRYVIVTVISVHLLTVQSDINPRATVASIKVLFRGIKASNHTRFALSHARALGILPVSQINATVRAAFVPDSTLEFLPIFSSSKCTKASIFSGFLHSWRWFGPRKLPRCFQA